MLVRLLKADSGEEEDAGEEGEEPPSSARRVLTSAFAECTRVRFIAVRRGA